MSLDSFSPEIAASLIAKGAGLITAAALTLSAMTYPVGAQQPQAQVKGAPGLNVPPVTQMLRDIPLSHCNYIYMTA